MKSGTVVPELQRVIGAEGRALLNKFNLLNPLVEQMVTREAVAAVAVTDQQIEEARVGLLQQRGYDGVEQWAELLEETTARSNLKRFILSLLDNIYKTLGWKDQGSHVDRSVQSQSQ